MMLQCTYPFYRRLAGLLCISAALLVIFGITGHAGVAQEMTSQQQAVKIETILTQDLHGLASIALSRAGEFVGYCVEMHDPTKKDQVGLYSTTQQRLLWSKDMPEGVKLTAGNGVVFSERDHAPICAYVSTKTQAAAKEKFVSGFFIFNSTGQLERDVVVSPLTARSTPAWLAIPIFADVRHIVTIQPTHDSVEAVQIFSRKGDMVKTITATETGPISNVAVSPDGTYLVFDTPKVVTAMNFAGEKLWTFEASMSSNPRATFTKNARYLVAQGGSWLAESKWPMDSWRKAGRTEDRYAYSKQVTGQVVLDQWGNPVWGYANVAISGPLPGPASPEGTRIGDFDIQECYLGGEKRSVTLLTWSGQTRKLYLIGDEYHPAGGPEEEDAQFSRVVELPNASTAQERVALSADGQRIVIVKPIADAQRTVVNESVEIYSYRGNRVASIEFPLIVPEKDVPTPPFAWQINVSDDGQYLALLAGSTLHVFKLPLQ